jgi:hypothetical protein
MPTSAAQRITGWAAGVSPKNEIARFGHLMPPNPAIPKFAFGAKIDSISTPYEFFTDD